jgi:beta-fructofuranosidase
MNARILAAQARAIRDPIRPTYHFHSPSQWMNDPNGTIYSGGYFHLFYQFNPFGDSWDHMHWGHARSRDLVSWEYLPIALAPDKSVGEEHCFSGCVAMREDGAPELFYTSVHYASEGRPNCQRAALGDADFIRWERLAEPALELDSIPGLKLKGDWRDPYVFESAGSRYMILSAVTEDDVPVVLLFEAGAAKSLDGWEYKGILASFARGGQLFECPNFFSLRGAWVLLGSPFEPVRYFIGSFDEERGKFITMMRGLVDQSSEYYATNTAISPSGETYLFAWIRAFPKGHGWNGCLALPRVLDIDDEGLLLRSPARELEALRRDRRGLADCERGERSIRFPSSALPASETRIEIELVEGSTFSLDAALAGGGRVSLISLDEGAMLRSLGTATGIAGLARERPRNVEIRAFIDRSVLEVFVDHGRVCMSHMIESLCSVEALELSWDASASLALFESWRMAPLEYSVYPGLPEDARKAPR